MTIEILKNWDLPDKLSNDNDEFPVPPQSNLKKNLASSIGSFGRNT